MKLTIQISRAQIQNAKRLLCAERQGEMLADEEDCNMAAGAIVIATIAAAEAKKDQRAPAGVCRRCGCTDQHGCACGCSWVASNLCSACVVPSDKIKAS